MVEIYVDAALWLFSFDGLPTRVYLCLRNVSRIATDNASSTVTSYKTGDEEIEANGREGGSEWINENE